MTCYFGGLPTGSYELEVGYSQSKPPLRWENIKIDSVVDKTPPVIVDVTPGPTPVFLDTVRLRFTFSEPLDTAKITPQTFVLSDGMQQIPVTLEWQDVFHLQLHPADLSEGASYTVGVTEFDIADYSGNLLGDSLRTFTFTIIDSDSLGSVSGEVVVTLPGKQGSPARLTFQKVGSSQTFPVTTTGHSFHIEVPAGKYLLSGFLDEDLDGKKGAGSIFPYAFAETFARYPDTISVRARFETTGIRFEFK